MARSAKYKMIGGLKFSGFDNIELMIPTSLVSENVINLVAERQRLTKVYDVLYEYDVELSDVLLVLHDNFDHNWRDKEEACKIVLDKLAANDLLRTTLHIAIDSCRFKLQRIAIAQQILRRAAPPFDFPEEIYKVIADFV